MGLVEPTIGGALVLQQTRHLRSGSGTFNGAAGGANCRRPTADRPRRLNQASVRVNKLWAKPSGGTSLFAAQLNSCLTSHQTPHFTHENFGVGSTASLLRAVLVWFLISLQRSNHSPILATVGSSWIRDSRISRQAHQLPWNEIARAVDCDANVPQTVKIINSDIFIPLFLSYLLDRKHPQPSCQPAQR
jgi:hypothetical protein